MAPTELLDLPEALATKRSILSEHLAKLGSVIVAYSGGVDSSVLAYYARHVLGKEARIVIALSPSLAQSELLAARRQAESFQFDLIEIATQEVELDQYRRNDSMRCFFCKSTLFEYLQQIKEELSVSAIAYGANMDDLSDVRPGHQAAANYNVVAPLLQSGLYKWEIRALAQSVGLPSYDRPQAACLSSRFPQDVYIDPDRLALVDKAEEAVRALGFRQVRVRFRENNTGISGRTEVPTGKTTGVLATVEVGVAELAMLENRPDMVDLIASTVRRFGFSAVYVDRRGYTQGGADDLSHSDLKKGDISGPAHG